MISFESFFVVLMIIIFALIILNIFLSYKEYKQIRKFKEIEKVSKKDFIKNINFLKTELGGFICEVNSYIDEEGDEVLYIKLGSRMYILYNSVILKRKLEKYDEIYIYKACIDSYYETKLPLYVKYYGLKLNKNTVIDGTRKRYYYSSFFVDDDENRVVEEIESELYEKYSFYYQKVSEITKMNFIHYLMNDFLGSF